MPFGLVVKNALNILSACSGAMPVAEILGTNNAPILEMLGTHSEHVRTICDGGHGVDCIRKQVQKHLLQLYSIGLDERKVIEKL